MKRVYDSVSWNKLEHAFKRIKMNSKYISLCNKIHNQRLNQVITEYGYTDQYPVHDGLDQGEVNAPILWRIFYDPLLCYINNHHSTDSYTIT